MPPSTRDACVAVILAVLLSVALTWPLAAGLGSTGRVDSGDGRHGVWNVAWVAHALTTAPTTVFDANIFFPNPHALAFSEANLVAGVLAIPAWVISGGNPYAAYNSVVLMAFTFAALSAYFLARTVGSSRFGAAIAALIYGYSPYMFAHLPHIQLLMTFGPALSLAMLHRFVDQPTTQRAIGLGLSLTVTGLACAYYGIFIGLVVTIGVIWFAVTDGRWRSVRYWALAALAATVTVACIAPFFLPYLGIQDDGFVRRLEDARPYSTTGRAFLASAVLVHRWMLPLIEQWRDVLFPGFLSIALSLGAVWMAWQHRTRERWRMVGFYLVIAIVSYWIAMGPDGGLYSVLYHTLPVFSFLRAPIRMGVLVTLVTGILAALALTWLGARVRAFRPAGLALIAIAVVESWVGPLELANAPEVPAVYERLARLPRAGVAEFPIYRGSNERFLNTDYMLMSTFHWQPILNGYSDHFPPDYFTSREALNSFPSRAAIDLMREKGVRWVVVHHDRYPRNRATEIRMLLRQADLGIRLVEDSPSWSLYEIIWPMRPVDPLQP